MCSRRFLGTTLWVFVAFSPGLPGCGQRHDTANPAGPPVVCVTRPVERQVTEYENFTGRTDAVDSVDVRARVTGYLTEIKFKPGQEVKENDVLFVIDQRPYKAALDQARAQILVQKAALQLAVADYNRAKVLAGRGGASAISQQDLDKFAATQAQAEASLKAAEANEQTADLNYNWTEVTAPVEGIIGRNLLTIGNLVTQDSTLLTTIVSEDPMYAYFDVDERTMLRVQELIRQGKFKSAKAGNKVPVFFGLATEGDRFPHEGYIDFVNNQVDTSTGTIQVRGVLPNPQAGKDPQTGKDLPRLLTPGLFVRVRVPVGERHSALLVPQAAVNTELGQKYLLVVNAEKVVEKRPVTLGVVQPDGLQEAIPIRIVRTDNDGKKGLRPAHEGEQGEASLLPGDEVIVRGLQRVREGMPVTPRPFDRDDREAR
jgi:multidrug efflux system membrane fusion protein